MLKKNPISQILIFIFVIFFAGFSLNFLKATESYEGKLVKMEGSVIYYYINNGKRDIIPFITGFEGYRDAVLASNGWNAAEAVPLEPSILGQYPLGQNATVKAGSSYLLKKQSEEKYYLVDHDNYIKEVSRSSYPGYTVAVMSEAFFPNYTVINTNKPDLAISSASVMPNNVNTSVKDVAVYFNRLSSSDFKQYRIKLYDQISGRADYKTVTSEVQGNVDFSLPAGTYDLMLTIDCDNVIDEADENNNTKQLSATIVLEKKPPLAKSPTINSNYLLSAYCTTAEEASCVLVYSLTEGFASSLTVTADIVQRATLTNDGLYHYYAKLANVKDNYYYKFRCVYNNQQSLESSVYRAITQYADFTVTDIGLKYYSGGNPGYYVYALVKNSGSVAVNDNYLALLFSGFTGVTGLSDGYAAPVLPEGKYASPYYYYENKTWEAKGPSTNQLVKNKAYQVSAQADVNNLFAETNEANNKYTKTLTWTGESGNTASNTASCTDSDSGKDYFTKGEVKAIDNNFYPSLVSYPDMCIIEGDKQYVSEKYCENGAVKEVAYLCPNGCENAACKKDTQACPGPYMVLNANNNCVWSCGEGTTPGLNHECVCKTGYKAAGTDHLGRLKCVESAPEKCTDSDGGKMPTRRGTTFGYDSYGGTTAYKSYEDKCDGGDRVMEFYCETQNDPTGGKGYVSMVNTICPNGCGSGACQPSAISTDATSTKAYDVKIAHVSTDFAIVKWLTTKADVSYLLYGTADTGEGRSQVASQAVEKTSHELKLAGLTPDTSYYFRIISDSGAVSLSESATYGFKTLSASSENARKEDEIEKFNETAKLLKEDKMETILAELQILRDRLKEQEAEIKYLRSLTKGLKNVTEEMSGILLQFIAYGVDDNTNKLGAGERAAVLNSYKAAFGKLPEDTEELADAIKIANGRWPEKTSEQAEKKAKEKFRKVYKKIADMDDPRDNAAVTTMAYGLRQKAENRSLVSEQSGIKIFKDIYGRAPSSTEDWNIMQAVTYSGARRDIDTDGDFLIDEREREFGTNALERDSDRDGYIDGVEVENGYNPLD